MGIRDSAPGDPPRWLRSPSKRGSPGRWIPSSPAWQRPVKVTAFANAIAAPPRSGKSVKLSPQVHPNTISPSPWYWTPTLAAWRAGAAGDNWRLVAQPPQEPRWLQAWKLDQPSKNFSLSLSFPPSAICQAAAPKLVGDPMGRSSTFRAFGASAIGTTWDHHPGGP